METDTSLVRTDGVVVLNTVAHVVLDLSLVINPRHAERENTVGYAEALDEVVTLKFRMFVVFILDSSDYLFHCLKIFRLIGKATFQVV